MKGSGEGRRKGTLKDAPIEEDEVFDMDQIAFGMGGGAGLRVEEAAVEAVAKGAAPQSLVDPGGGVLGGGQESGQRMGERLDVADELGSV
jgi:hypothetical protein